MRSAYIEYFCWVYEDTSKSSWKRKLKPLLIVVQKSLKSMHSVFIQRISTKFLKTPWIQGFQIICIQINLSFNSFFRGLLVVPLRRLQGGPEEKEHMQCWVVSLTSCFFLHFTWRSDWQVNCSSSDLDAWQMLYWKWTRWAFISREITDNICCQW